MAVALAVVTIQCGADHGLPPTKLSDDSFLTVHLTPDGGDLTWELGPGVWPVRFTPPLSWRADFVTPDRAWKLDVDVRLQDGAGTTCFWAKASIDDPSRGFPYVLTGDTFLLPEGSRWYQNPCGDSFTITTAEAVLSLGHTIGLDRGGEILKTVRVPCQYEVRRTGSASPASAARGRGPGVGSTGFPRGPQPD